MADQVTTSLAEAKVLVMQGLKGDTGYSPQIEVLDITGGHQVRITYKADQTHIQTDVFNVMDGAPGLNGEDGFSPTVEVQDITQSLPGGGTEVIGHKVIITDANGPHIFNVMDGEDGEGGGGEAAEAVLYIAQSLTAAQKAQARTNIDAGTYSKPSGGIPASDLASGVIPVVPQMATQTDMSDWTSGKTVDAAVLKADFSSAIQRLGGLEISADDLQTAVSQKADFADIPTKTSDLTNDSGFQTAAQVQSAVDEVTNMMPYVVEEINATEEINIDDGADNVPVRDMTLKIGVQQTGEGTPSSSNVRPITGFTNASAFRSGKNLLHISGREVAPSGNILNTTPRDFSKPFLYVGITVNNYYNKNNAVYSVDGETLTVMSKSGGYGVGLNVDVEPDTDYVLSMGGGLTTSYAGFGFFDASGSFISFQYESSLSFRTPANCEYLMLVLRPKDPNVEVQYTNVQLERGTTATAYEAPETVFSYDFSEPIYGGTIDPVTGVLTVTHANIASYNGEAVNEPWYSSVNAYASGTTPTTGAQVVYPLSNPVTYQLEKTAVKTKYGANTIWGNTGMISTRYCADMKMYIDHAIEVAMGS